MSPEHLLETIFNQVFIAVIVVDAQQRVVYANEHAFQLFEVPRNTDTAAVKDFAGQCRYFDWSGTEIPLEKLAIFRVLDGEKVEPHNVKLGLPDGSFKWVHVTTHRFSVMGLNGAIMVATDETREVELQRIAATAQKAELLNILAASLAHNFNNVLSIIRLETFVCLSSRDLGTETRTRLQHISDAANEASELVKRLAQFSRTRQIHPRATSINQLIRDTLAMAETVASSDIKVVADLDPDLPNVEVDRVEMEQVLLNLLLNARDAMPQGGQLTVTTNLQTRYTDPTLGTWDKPWVTVTVTDTGTGIPEDILDDIFEPFFTTKPNGTGLGLASTQGIVQQHGGQIKVQSTVGKGTQFTIYLPTKQVDSAAVDAA
jgi:signal transduction histidine kinase